MGTWTYENGNTSNYLVYQADETETIDTVALGMITNNTIPGVLPLIFMQNNSDRFVKYNITAKVSMKMFFDGVITKKKFLTVMSGICGALMNCDDYMLELSSFVLNTEYIYIDVSTSKAFLVCVPFLTEKAELNYKDFFKNILFCSQFDQSENCDYIAKIITFLNTDQSCTLKSIRDFADKMLKEEGPDEYVRPEIINQSAVDPKINQAVQVSAPVINRDLKTEAAVVPINFSHQNIPQASSAEDGRSFKRKKSFSVGFNKNKNDKKEKKAKASDAPSMAIPGAEIKQTAPSAAAHSSSEVKSVSSGFTDFAKTAPSQQSAAAPSYIPIEALSSQPAANMNTTVLSKEMLSPNAVPTLYRLKTNTSVSLDKPVFRIGKEPSFVDYCISDNTAISRSHANIIRRGDDYYIVDTNSTNHTFVNGNMINSNEEIRLEQGYKIRFANEEFEFRFY